MSYKTIIINGIEYEQFPAIDNETDCQNCFLRDTKYCIGNYICIEEDCYFVPKEL